MVNLLMGLIVSEFLPERPLPRFGNQTPSNSMVFQYVGKLQIA